MIRVFFGYSRGNKIHSCDDDLTELTTSPVQLALLLLSKLGQSTNDEARDFGNNKKILSFRSSENAGKVCVSLLANTFIHEFATS